jgi:hypothetical protein
MAHPQTDQPAVTLSRLPEWKAHLARLRRRRSAIRIAAGAVALVLAVVLALPLLFLVDWTFRLNHQEHVVLLAALVTTVVWAAWRWLLPALRTSETEAQLALLLDREARLGGDLIAALQFDAADASWNSSRSLEQAVIDRVTSIHPLPRPSPAPATGRLRRLVLVGLPLVAALAALIWLRPIEARIFAAHLCLGTDRYPTRTLIAALSINGTPVSLDSSAPVVFRLADSSPARFEVECRGELPAGGDLRMTDTTHAQSRLIPLNPGNPNSANTPSTSRTYFAEVRQLHESVTCTIQIGDADRDPLLLEIVPLPTLDWELTITPPEYVAHRRSAVHLTSLRQASVLEGSRVGLQLRSANKPLRSALLRTSGHDWPLAPVDAERRNWQLNAPDSPLANITEPLKAELQVVDDDGLAPEPPPAFTIAIEPDHPPRVSATAVTDRVLPQAEPTLSWNATDDFGLANVRLAWQIFRSRGDTEQGIIPLLSAEEPPPTSRAGRYPLPLSPWELSPGDEVRLTIEAVDARGAAPGLVARGEPVRLKVTDENGILAGLRESDEQTARELDELIQRQLGIGAAP